MGAYFESKKWRQKDLIRLENKERIDEEVATIALVGTHATIATIREYRVVEKSPASLGEEIRGVVRCPNPNRITNHDPICTWFRMEMKEPLRIRCHFCERIIREGEIELI